MVHYLGESGELNKWQRDTLRPLQDFLGFTRGRIMLSWQAIFIIITYLLAILLLVAINLSLWLIMVFPAWVLAISVYILVESLRGKSDRAAIALGADG